MKQYKIFMFQISVLLLFTSSCNRTQQTRETTEVRKTEKTENSRPEVLSEPGRYKKRLNLIIAQLNEEKEDKYLSRVSSVPEDVRQAVDLVEHSIHMRAPIYHCIEYGEFYLMTDQTYRAKNPLDVLRGAKSELDGSFIFTHGFAIKIGEQEIREFRIEDE